MWDTIFSSSNCCSLQCFFPQNVVPNIQTPTFILNTAYDVWQVFLMHIYIYNLLLHPCFIVDRTRELVQFWTRFSVPTSIKQELREYVVTVIETEIKQLKEWSVKWLRSLYLVFSSSNKAWPQGQLTPKVSGEDVGWTTPLVTAINFRFCTVYFIAAHVFWVLLFFFVKTRSIHLVCFDSGFRSQMLNAVSGFSASRQNGVFINSCFAHCQSERQDTWYANSSPRLGNKVLRCAATNHLLLIPL
jgi:hypothetical protein